MRQFDWSGLAMFTAGCAFVGAIWMSAARDTEQPAKPTPDAVLVARVAELERRADEQAKIRCLNVTTGRMDLAIFPVDNIGRKP